MTAKLPPHRRRRRPKSAESIRCASNTRMRKTAALYGIPYEIPPENESEEDYLRRRSRLQKAFNAARKKRCRNTGNSSAEDTSITTTEGEEEEEDDDYENESKEGAMMPVAREQRHQLPQQSSVATISHELDRLKVRLEELNRQKAEADRFFQTYEESASCTGRYVGTTTATVEKGNRRDPLSMLSAVSSDISTYEIAETLCHLRALCPG